MVTPAEWITEKTRAVKSGLGQDPEATRLQAEMKTAEKDKSFRDENYFNNPKSNFRPAPKPTPIRIKSNRITSGRVDVGRARG